MLDLSLVTRALAGPGQDASSVVLEEILRLAQAGEQKAAAERAADALQAGATDIRIVVALLLGAFVERGPAALPEIFATARAAITDRWESLRPAARKPRTVDGAFSLLFRAIRSTIDFHESRRDATWKAWTSVMAHGLSERCAAAASALSDAIEGAIPSAQSAQELLGLRARADTYLQRLPAPPPSPPPPEPEPEPVNAEPEPEPEPEQAISEPPPSPPPGSDRPSDPVPSGRALPVSAALERFIQKLEAFEALVQRGEMGKAAIVAQDVRRVVEHFDPRVYLPALLAPHFRLLSSHIDEISPHWEAAEGPAWQALEQLYQVDLEAFVGP